MSRLVCLAATVLVAANLWSQPGLRQGNVDAEADAAIRAVLKAQVEAWNRHDLETFMTGYWQSPNLTFFSGGTETSGWDHAFERYRSRYQSAGSEMGTLSFTELQVVVLAPDAALVRGQFHLTTIDGKNPHGLFTLVFRKLPEGWRIVHDHTSAAP